jgi:Methyltransferase domain
LGWFEVLYSRAGQDASTIPWADLAPNPNLVAWFEKNKLDGAGRTAIKVGCGLGDDAEELSRRRFRTTAFDISKSAIDWCERRHGQTRVTYLSADLFKTPEEWRGKFDFVLESYILQVLPPDMRAAAMGHIASLAAVNGTVLVIARGREIDEPKGKMPWPLTKGELEVFRDFGLEELTFEDFRDNEPPPVRRFRATYRKN